MLEKEYQKVVQANIPKTDQVADQKLEDAKNANDCQDGIQDKMQNVDENNQKNQEDDQKEDFDDPLPQENDEDQKVNEDDDDFGDFQEGQYCVLGSDEDNLSNESDEDEADNDKLDEALKYESQEGPLKADDIPMSDEKVSKIKNAMSKLNLTPPPWAKAIPEEKWLNKLLYGNAQK